VTAAEVHTLTGAYAAGALTDDERREFEAHLRHCSSCTQEVRELVATTARLAAVVAEPAPDGLRERVMSEISRTRQLPPGTPPTNAGSGQAWYRQPLAVAAALLLVVSAGLAVATTEALHSADVARSRADRIEAIVADPAHRVLTQPVSSGGSGTVVVSGKNAIFSASDLAPLPAGKTYQLWVMGPDGARSARSVDVLGDSPGRRIDRLVTGLAADDAVGLSIEPSGGSRRPTTDPVLVIRLSA
jgi:anti-sigma-K factor RskA